VTDLLTFARQLRAAHTRATSELGHLWTPGSPSTGQCHTSAILIQEAFGGDIIEGEFDGIAHFMNDLGGIHLDVTRDQFPRIGTLRMLGVADDPLPVTMGKARRLAWLAGLEKVA
jgi:hypothetical protein